MRVRGELRGEELRVLVENSGSGDAPEAMGTGVGLQNVRRRLEICYGPAAALRLTPNPQVTTVEICIPLAVERVRGA